VCSALQCDGAVQRVGRAKLQRTEMTADELEQLDIIGRGAFGEVRSPGGVLCLLQRIRTHSTEVAKGGCSAHA
jgi:hypothetical protein